METFPVVIVTMVDEGGFYGYMSTVNGTQTLWKIPLSFETIYDSLKIYTPLWFTYDVHLKIKLTRTFIASLTFMHPVEASIPNFSSTSL